MTLAKPTLRLTTQGYREILGHCFDAVDLDRGELLEACGLLGGPVDRGGEPLGLVTRVYPCRNSDASARTYTVDSRDYIKALRDAEDRGETLVGVFHSHTHSDAYPSDTDVRQAFEPAWIYVLVSVRPEQEPVLRAYRIRDGTITEVPVVRQG